MDKEGTGPPGFAQVVLRGICVGAVLEGIGIIPSDSHLWGLPVERLGETSPTRAALSPQQQFYLLPNILICPMHPNLFTLTLNP